MAKQPILLPWGCILSVLLLVVMVGCGDGRPTRVAVAGKVTIDGKPVASGAVRFFPETGRPATGNINADGTFSLFTFDANDGCVPGNYRVAVMWIDYLSETQQRWNLPKKYGNPNTSGISKAVAEATDSMLIELTWGGAPGPFIENVQ